MIRRVVSTNEAFERLGGPGSRIAQGAASALLMECALDAVDFEAIQSESGRSVHELSSEVPTRDRPALLYALALLGVIEVMPAIGQADEALDGEMARAAEAIDSDAIRARVQARMQVVEDGDYFAVLGVAHTATGYEVRRAFLELRRAFEPSQILKPEVADLADDVRKIVTVIEEAYDVLRDEARRARYRLAIES
jgi:hypothetical protein